MGGGQDNNNDGDPVRMSLVSLEEVQALISITSWGVCGSHAIPDLRNRLAGRYAKRILDLHRAMFIERMLNMPRSLRQQGTALPSGPRFRARLVEYIDEDITPENAAIVVDLVTE